MADNVRALVIKSGTTQNIPAADSLLVGSGIDASAVGALTIGGTTANAITIGQASPFTTTFPGDVDIQGNINTIGGTTFTADVTFEGNTTFGVGAADTVTFAPLTTVINDIAFNGLGYRITNMLPGVAGTDAANVNQVNAIAAIEYDQQIFVAAGADPLVATGAPLRPFASISAAMAAITDALPTKRYAISVAAGAYTEASALDLKPNVFIIGVSRDAVRITAPSFGLDASFTGGADNRSGISNAIVTGTASFNFTTVTSAAGKLYFRDTSFNSALTLTGYNNATVQAQFSGCQMFAVLTVQGVNVGVFNNNVLFSNIVLTQSTFGGVPTILVATGGACSGTVTATTTVNDFTRRCSVFARSFWMNGAVTVDGPSSYLDYTVDSLPSGGASTLNGGNLVSIDYGANKALSNLVYPTAVNNPIIPASTNATNMGDWNKQWFFSFGYVHLSSGTDLYIGSAGTAAAADSAGRAVYLQPDQYGVDVNVNGGVLDLRSANTTGTGISGNVDVNTGTVVNGNSGDVTLTTGAVSGTGTRGVISLDGREIDANSTKIVNLANGTNPNDAVNVSQLSAIVSGVSSFQTSLSGLTPSSATGGAITLAGTLGVTSGGTGATSLTSGSLLAGNGAGTVAEIAPGAEGNVLTVVSGAWAAAPAVASAVDVQVTLDTTTNSVAAGDACYSSANGVPGVVNEAIADGVVVNTARALGISVGATADKVSVAGLITCNFETSLSPVLAVGQPVYLSTSSAGKLTNAWATVTGTVNAEVGIVTSVTTPAGGALAAQVLWQPKTIIVL